MYLDIRFHLKCLAIFWSVRKQPPEVFLWWRLWGGHFSCGFCIGGEGGGHLFYRSPLGDCFCLFICSFFNLKSFIRVILQIFKLRKNILLNIICIRIMKKNYIYILYWKQLNNELLKVDLNNPEILKFIETFMSLIDCNTPKI